MPAGPLPEKSCELFTTPRFANLINMVAEKYDYVLIDTGPLLALADPCVVAARADAVVLVLRINKDSRRRAERARELLDTLDLKLCGVVVNDIGGRGSSEYRSELQDHTVLPQVRDRRQVAEASTTAVAT
jgi:Mrp family chromosome partitioning ATPase